MSHATGLFQDDSGLSWYVTVSAPAVGPGVRLDSVPYSLCRDQTFARPRFPQLAGASAASSTTDPLLR
jgi:hypothetical protein